MLAEPIEIETANPARDYIESVVVGFVLTVLSYFVGRAAGWITSVDLLEAFAVFTSYSCTWLCNKQRRFNYIVGAISTTAYCALFWRTDLVASAVLNLYLTFQLIYGWFRWRRDEITRPVTLVALKMVPVYLAVTGLFYLGALLVIHAAGGRQGPWDGLILACSVLAQFLLDNKKLENWLVWVVVNVLSIYVYVTADLPLVAFQYVFFLLNTGYGFYLWKRDLHDG